MIETAQIPTGRDTPRRDGPQEPRQRLVRLDSDESEKTWEMMTDDERREMWRKAFHRGPPVEQPPG